METRLMEKDAVLLVFAKAPTPGTVKTRLAGEASVLSEKESAQLYAAFLKDALAQYVALAETVAYPLAIQLHWSGAVAEAEPFVAHARTAMREQGCSSSTINVIEQEGDGLGTRMANAFQQALRSYKRAFIIGTDHPTLPDAFIEEAFHVLSEAPMLCIGPSTDGGYYGLGMNRWTPDVFADMTYSHSHVFTDTLHRARRTNRDLSVLPEFYDVDTPSALRRMLQDISDPRSGAPETRSGAPETCATVRDLNLYARLEVSP